MLAQALHIGDDLALPSLLGHLLRMLLLAQEERFHGAWLLQQPGGAIKRVLDGPFQTVESQAPSVRVHH
jgi:hypothetical protein